jgi:hypothetical protein
MQAMNRFHEAPHARRGGVLVLSLVAVGVVAILSMTYLQLSASVTRRQVAAVDTSMSFYLAEAGLAESYSGLTVGHTGRVGTPAEPAIHGEGVFWVEATQLSEDLIELESTGMAKSGKAVLGMVVRRGRQNVGALGIFSDSDLTVPNNALIDGYDSAEGGYAEQAAEDHHLVELARVGSNGNVYVNEGRSGDTRILGDVTPGPSGSLHTAGSPTITGETDGSAGLIDLPDVVVPPAIVGPGVSQGAGAPLVVPAGRFGAEFMTLAANSEVVLRGPLDLVLGDLSVGPGAELVFDTANGPVNVYVSDAFELDTTAVLTTGQEDASLVSLNASGTAPLALDCAGAFYGSIYAPQATVSVSASFELYGSVVSKSLALAPGSKLHYDEHLVEAGADDELPHVVSWRIIELPQASPTTVGVDPFAILGVSASALPTPAKAHEDQDLEITYLNTLLLPALYSGPESAFDWAQVRVVLLMKRTGGLVESDIVRVAADGGLCGNSGPG